MGAGAGVMGKMGPEMVEKMKDVSDEDIKKAAATISTVEWGIYWGYM